MVKATVNPSFYPDKEILKDCRRAYGPRALAGYLRKLSNLPYKIMRMYHLNLDPSVKRAQFFIYPGLSI
jgi:hypothetical protein